VADLLLDLLHGPAHPRLLHGHLPLNGALVEDLVVAFMVTIEVQAV
jgi:hypothetical protein